MAGRKVWIVACVAVLVAAGLAVFAWWRSTHPPANNQEQLPDVGSDKYALYVGNFEVGLAALDAGAGLEKIADQGFSQAIEAIPQEPAGWADRGLLRLRNNDLDAAAGDLQQAQTRAPDNADIDALLGLLARKQGKFAEALEHLRKAVSLQPHDALARYALANVIEQEGGPDSEAEYQHELETLLQDQPSNLFLLQQLTITAARRSDSKALREVLAQLQQRSGMLAPEARSRLAKVQKTVSATGVQAGLLPEVLTLGNLLMATPEYSRSKAAIDPAVGAEGRPIRHFIRLQSPPPSPSPADLETTFAAAVPVSSKRVPSIAAAHWDVVLPVWLTTESGPAVFVANSGEVGRADGDAPAVAFPGGKGAVAPTANGVLAVDWNNDYRTDLLLAGAGGLRFWQQKAKGAFSDVTAKTTLPMDVLNGDYFGAWTADIDMDGHLDLVVAPRHGAPLVLRNNGDGTFNARKPFTGLTDVRAFVWVDVDNDGAADAAFLDATGKLHVFMNERGGQFRARSVPESIGKCLALTAADVKTNGVLALVALRGDGTIIRIANQDKGGTWDVLELAHWSDASTAAQPGTVMLLAADLDNNGAIDIVVAGPHGGQAWLAEDGKFKALKATVPARLAAAIDLDGRGRLDLLALSPTGQPVRLRSQGKKAYHWQDVRPQANDHPRPDQRINSFAIGGTVEIRAGMLVCKQIIANPQVHFGLGVRDKPDLIRYIWTNGDSQSEFSKPADVVVKTLQRLSGSCPFLFTYDGQRMRFVADFMWSTPLGMYINAQNPGGFVQTTEWIKVRGDQLKPRDDYYDVRVTAELWEAHFDDMLALMTVDHPEGTEIFVNEGFPLVPRKPELYVTTPPRPVAHAWDDRGHDVTDVVRRVDGRYLNTFGFGSYQGVTRDHWVEVDLGDDAPKHGPLWLVATGWLRPTDSSINVALEHGKHDRPRPLVLEVPDGKGGWKVARDDLGFPAGKNKTLMIRLDNPPGQAVARRFRLRTNMEIYWDALSYATGLPKAPTKRHWLTPTSAELRYRGYSRMTEANSSSPELPHYDEVTGTGQKWRDLIGFYTRYGDVRELLLKADDRYVIMNAGDEIAMRFAVPPGPKPGWTRDFVWVSDGWTKDGNLNTRFSKTVLPLPSHDLKTYDRPPGRLTDDPIYRRFPDDWTKYHTRYVTPYLFERGLRPTP